MATDATRAPDSDDASPGLLSSAVGDRCANCNAPLASDQRYCVNCGTRRGRPRFSLDTSAAKTAPVKTAAPPPRKRRQPTTAMTIIGFIGVLLLAMGVGVLIGHDGNSTTTTQAASTKPIVVNVGGGTGGGVAASTGAAAAGSTAATKSKTKSSKSSASNSSSGGSAKNGAKNVSGNSANGNGSAAAKQINKKTAAAASQAAAKALGSAPVNNPTVQPGQTASGPGTQNGKFTGTFFSGGQ